MRRVYESRPDSSFGYFVSIIVLIRASGFNFLACFYVLGSKDGGFDARMRFDRCVRCSY